MKMKMFETTLTDKDSKFVENEVQDIDITSTIDRETYVSFIISFNPKTIIKNLLFFSIVNNRITKQYSKLEW